MNVRGPYITGSGGQVGWEVSAMMSQPPDPASNPWRGSRSQAKFMFREEDWARMADENNLCALILSGGIPQAILDEWMLAAKLMHQ